MHLQLGYQVGVPAPEVPPPHCCLLPPPCMGGLRGGMLCGGDPAMALVRGLLQAHVHRPHSLDPPVLRVWRARAAQAAVHAACSVDSVCKASSVNPSYLPTYLDIYLPNEWFLITWQAVAIQLPWRRQALVTVPDCMCTMLLHALVALHRPDQHVSSVRGACLSLLSCGTAILVSRYMEQQACHKLAASRQCATAASAAAADRTAAAGPGPGTAAGTASVDGAQGAGGSSSRVCQSGQQLSSIRQRHKVQAAGAAGSQSAAPGSASATHAGQQAVAAAAPTSVPEHVWEDVTLSTQGLAGGPVPAHPELSPVVAAGCGVSIKLAGSGSILRGARQPGSGSSVGASGCVDVVGGGSGHVGSRCTTSTDSSGPMPPAVASAGDEAVAPAVAPRGDRAVAAAAPEHGDGTVAVTITSAVARREPAAVAQGRAAAELTQQICQLVVQRRQYKSQLQRFRLHCSLSGVTAPPSGLSAEALALRLQSLIREAGPPGLMVISATWSTTGQTSPTPDT
eukprot:CAMPEP_0202898512 /NCGR_PEP_ID=MMETSP1392-20130828/7023_1 /ASSEMBLY_ACC=CAM_ASM_000868 /TAXON_ID=225041 /ORGANISM="Chlamydomonas chlamydogama, Strain SAG 11-48b" /LENGTH=509 /DNA_ID=CAMNT_0049584463 /DNA_START=439 /DNA_END=1969 /DNA_ORIENTATION=-